VFSVHREGKKGRLVAATATPMRAGREFIGVISKDEEDGELSYHFSMAILDIDLE